MALPLGKSSLLSRNNLLFQVVNTQAKYLWWNQHSLHVILCYQQVCKTAMTSLYKMHREKRLTKHNIFI